MKLRGSKRRRAIRQNEAYILSGRFEEDVKKINDASKQAFEDMSAIATKVIQAFDEFVEWLYFPIKQSDVALAAPSDQ